MVMTYIYSKSNWYRECPEPEMMWKGIIREEPTQAGPNTRTALGYTLISEDIQLPVYSANAEEQLAKLARRPVLVYGKLVNLSEEGFGQEVWIGSIEIAEDDKGHTK